MLIFFVDSLNCGIQCLWTVMLLFHLQKVLWLLSYITLVFMHSLALGNELVFSFQDAHQYLTEQVKIHCGIERWTSLEETRSSPPLWATPCGMGTDNWRELTCTSIISVSGSWISKFPRWLQNTECLRSVEVPIVMGTDIWEGASLKRLLRKHIMCLSRGNAAFEFFCLARLVPLDSAGGCPIALLDPKWENKELWVSLLCLNRNVLCWTDGVF